MDHHEIAKNVIFYFSSLAHAPTIYKVKSPTFYFNYNIK